MDADAEAGMTARLEGGREAAAGPLVVGNCGLWGVLERIMGVWGSWCASKGL